MHRCLQVYELAARIAEACVPYHKNAGSITDVSRGYKPKLGALCALARTCRTLQEPAFDVLWSFQFGLQNLIKCMPEDLWEIHRIEDFSQRYKPRGTPDHFDFDELVILHYLLLLVLFYLLFLILSNSRRPGVLPETIGNGLTFMPSVCAGLSIVNTTWPPA